LEKLNFIEPPAKARICEKLSTQSHDKLTIQWRTRAVVTSPSSSSLPTTSSCADKYEVRYTIEDAEGCCWMSAPNIRDNHYTINGLQSCTKYLVAVKSLNRAGSSMSDVIAVKTLGIPFQLSSHGCHKKLRIINHGYSVMTSSSADQRHQTIDSSLYGVSGDVIVDCGTHYWEVVVCRSTNFSLGVALSDANKFEWNVKNNSSKNASWTMTRNNQSWFGKQNGKETRVFPQVPFPKKIGVLLNFDCGRISFFDGASGVKIQDFNAGKFPKPVRPVFAAGSKSTLTINTGICIPEHLMA